MSDVTKAVNIADLRLRAKRRLPKGIFDFIDGGAEDEISLADNRAGFERIRLVPRVLIDVDTPDMVTVSLRQQLTNNLRVLGTVEWTNWDRLDVHPIIVGGAPIGAFDFQWDDGWFFSGGIEYDVSKQLTVRGGVAYEISPIDSPTQRLPQVPDSDRIWLSFGATYNWSETMSFDIGYTHVFFDDARLDRLPAAAAASGFRLVADTESSADIVAASVKMKW